MSVKTHKFEFSVQQLSNMFKSFLGFGQFAFSNLTVSNISKDCSVCQRGIFSVFFFFFSRFIAMDSSDATSAPQELDDVHNVVRIKDLRSKLLR